MSKRPKLVRSIVFFEYKKQFFTSSRSKVFIGFADNFQINMYFCHSSYKKRNIMNYKYKPLCLN